MNKFAKLVGFDKKQTTVKTEIVNPLDSVHKPRRNNKMSSFCTIHVSVPHHSNVTKDYKMVSGNENIPAERASAGMQLYMNCVF